MINGSEEGRMLTIGWPPNPLVSWKISCNPLLIFYNYTTVDPKQFVFFNIETRACDVQSWETKDWKAEAATATQSWETSVEDCKAKTDTAVQSGRTHLKKELRSPDSKPLGELFFKCEHDAGHAAQSARS